MPKIWRLILGDATRLWVLIVAGAVGFMIVVQMHEIARFAALSSNLLLIAQFVGLQLPYILPNAIPLAGLLASYATFRRLSVDGELTSLRAGGCSLGQLLTPLLFFGVFLSLITFGIASEVAPQCRSLGKELLDRVAASNPLMLVHQKRLMRLSDSWVSAEPEGHTAASDFWMVLPVGTDHRLMLIHADNLSLNDGALDASGVLALLRHSRKELQELWMEQANTMHVEATGLSPFLLRNTLQRAEDYFGWAKQWRLAQEGCALAKHELLRRFVLGCAPLALIPLGAAFGMTTARQPKKIDLIIPVFISLLLLAGFIAGKSLPNHPAAYLPLFILPLCLAITAALWRLKRLQEGRTC